MPRTWDAGVVDEAHLRAIAVRAVDAARGGGVIHFEGDLGAGKTTFVRALLGALGIGERVKSPTYSLIESYRVGSFEAHHLDLYRIADAGELEWLGLGDLWTSSALVLIEWPERGRGALPAPDIRVILSHAGWERRLRMESATARGDRLLASFRAHADDGQERGAATRTDDPPTARS
jgi:tRNA threonylcarbamoyladenosine biosynthesis protein TsaE